MATPWSTRDLPAEPDQLSPSGASEIRLVPGFAAGEMAHAAVKPGEVAGAAVLSDMTEVYYVLSGRGELWRGCDGADEVVDLFPGRSASIPPGVSFQYRTADEPLAFLVASFPRWRLESWHEAPAARWPGDRGGSPAGGTAPWATMDRPEQPDYSAPDGSEIRLAIGVPGGGIAEALLPPGRTSSPVLHRTVEEVWFVHAGTGELWRALDGVDEVVALHPGRGVTIPRGTAFQFRARGGDPLRVVMLTVPPWPGAQEATSVWVAGMARRGA